MSIIRAGTTTTTALTSIGNTDGTIQLQVNGTTPSVTLNALGAVGVGAVPNFGTSGQVLISAGSTAAPTWAAPAAVNLATGVTGTLAVGNGGTGASSLTANNVLLGNGTSAVQVVAPGTTGNVLTSNGTTWVSQAAPASGTTTFVASGSITAGNAVQVNSNGTASVPSVTISTTAAAASTIATNSNAVASKTVYCPNVDRYVSMFIRQSDNFLMAALGTPSNDGSISYATPTVITAFNSSGNSLEAVWFSTQNVILVVHADNGGTGYAKTLTVTTSSITANSQLSSISFGSIFGLTYDTGANRAVMYWRDGNDGTGRVRAFSVSGTAVSMGSAITLNNTNPLVDGNIQYYPDQSKSLLLARNQQDSNLYAFLITVSGDTCSSTGFTNLSSTRPGLASMTYSPVAQKMVVALSPDGGVTSAFAVITVSGSTITMGSITTFSSSNAFWNVVQYDPALDRVACFYPTVSTGFLATRTGQISGTSISFGGETALSTGSGINNAERSAAYDPVRSRILIQWVTGTNEFARTIQIGSASLTANNFVGFAQNSVSDGQTVIVTVTGGVNGNQTGLTAASRYYLSASGNLSTEVSAINAGIALSSSSILVKG